MGGLDTIRAEEHSRYYYHEGTCTRPDGQERDAEVFTSKRSIDVRSKCAAARVENLGHSVPSCLLLKMTFRFSRSRNRLSCREVSKEIRPRHASWTQSARARRNKCFRTEKFKQLAHNYETLSGTILRRREIAWTVN